MILMSLPERFLQRRPGRISSFLKGFLGRGILSARSILVHVTSALENGILINDNHVCGDIPDNLGRHRQFHFAGCLYITYHIAAKKRGDGIVFLRKIVPGGADQSYGVEVAKLAGVPGRVVDRAREILADLERQGWVPARSQTPAEESAQVSLGDMAGAAVLEQLRGTTVETLTPIEAMNLLYQLKSRLN